MTYEDNNWSWHYISALLGFRVTPFPSTLAARPPLPPSTPCGRGRAPDCATQTVFPETALRLLPAFERLVRTGRARILAQTRQEFCHTTQTVARVHIYAKYVHAT